MVGVCMCTAKPREPPHFIVVLDSAEVMVGDNARFYCKATGIPVPEVMWYRSGEEMKADNRFVIRYDEVDGGCENMLIVVDVSTESEGVYEAVATNEYGTDSTEAMLIGRTGVHDATVVPLF